MTSRLRRYNKEYQVLMTPHQQYNPSFEFMLGAWTDENLMGFDVVNYRDRNTALCAAHDHPDINWHQLIEYHRDNYTMLKSIIIKSLNHVKMAVNFKSHLMNTEEVKNTFFERIMKGKYTDSNNNGYSDGGNSGNAFRLIYDMNDIISYTITNPWTSNLQELKIHLINTERLRIFDEYEKNYVTHLVGRTDIGTTYEIILVPDVINNWLDWRKLNKNIDNGAVTQTLKNAVRIQNMIDSQYKIR